MRITAAFDDHQHAEAAVHDLRRHGFTDAHLSILGRSTADVHATTGESTPRVGVNLHADVTQGAGTGAAAGVASGALIGLAVSLIPGAGPFLGAGVLASSIAGGVATGAVVGGSVGSLIGALGQAGYSDEEARYYNDAVQSGAVLLAVDARNDAQRQVIRDTLARHGARAYSGPHT